MPIEEPACECAAPGYCPRYKLRQDPYAHAVCQGVSLEGYPRVTAQKSQAFRRKWRLQLEGATTLPEQLATPSLGDAVPPQTPPGFGPGTELKKLLASLGLTGEAGCGCEAWTNAMDRGGAAWCQAHRGEILARLRSQQASLGWVARVRTAALAVTTGLATRLAIGDPAVVLLDEALARAAGQTAADPPPPAPSQGAAFPVRDLAYHLCPVASNTVWRWNVEMLVKRARLFTGRKVIACMTGDGLDPPEEVAKALAPLGTFELLTLPNDPELREVASLVPLLSQLESHDRGRVLFYAHSKGVTRPIDPGSAIGPWVEVLYEALLDYWPAVEELLSRFPIVGSMKKLGHGFGGNLSSWHYSGTFWAARSADLFARPWREADLWHLEGGKRTQIFGGEIFPSRVFDASEAGCVFWEAPTPLMNLYHNAYVRGVVIPAFNWWKTANQHRRTP
jgi:hypothetical protein